MAPGQGGGIWRRVFSAIRDLLLLQGSVENLKTQVDDLSGRFEGLQRQFDEQAAQLRVLSALVEKSLDDRIAMQIELAVSRAVEKRLAARRPAKKTKRTDKT